VDGSDASKPTNWNEGVTSWPLPELIISDPQAHVEKDAAPGPDGFVFVGVKGGQLRRSNFSKTWAAALAKAGLPGDVHVHDLRHTGNTFS
jgi:integrase